LNNINLSSLFMSSPAIATVLTMMESLPEEAQNRVAEHLREYIQDLHDELKRDKSLKKIESKLIAAAKRAKQEIAEGKAQPMDYDRL
jgi:ATP-dependent protease HslVU (ClpYQ) peptidase subunit